MSGAPCFLGLMSVTRTELGRSEWLEGKLICQSVVLTLAELDADHRHAFQQLHGCGETRGVWNNGEETAAAHRSWSCYRLSECVWDRLRAVSGTWEVSLG